MSYSVMFYSVDVPRLQAIYGSNDEALLNEVLASQANELDGNDEFFEDYGFDIDSRTALKNIFAGTVSQDDRSLAAMYGYVLKILCEHLGEYADSELYDVRILPIESKLMDNGPPLPIPDDPADFPEIGHLTAEEVQTEKAAAAHPLPAASPQFFEKMHEFTHHELDEDELLEELEAYQEVLEELSAKGLGTVAFRH